jgi:hypothetical protein
MARELSPRIRVGYPGCQLRHGIGLLTMPGHLVLEQDAESVRPGLNHAKVIVELEAELDCLRRTTRHLEE